MEPPQRRRAASPPRPPRLSPRECEVLTLAARGLSRREIAAVLGIKPRTVKGHLGRIYDKLGVRNHTEAANVARARGLIPVALNSSDPHPP